MDNDRIEQLADLASGKGDGRRLTMKAPELDTRPASHVEDLVARVAEMEARVRRLEDDDAWATSREVSIHAIGHCVKAVVKCDAYTAKSRGPTIAAAIRALREKVEGGSR
jgi:hypothetical protein